MTITVVSVTGYKTSDGVVYTDKDTAEAAEAVYLTELKITELRHKAIELIQYMKINGAYSSSCSNSPLAITMDLLCHYDLIPKVKVD